MKEKIKELLKKRNAIILAHNYQPPEIQDIADLCGDSLELSRKAAATDAEVILFCGVHFMAETASILSPQKKVLLPKQDAGCPMADMITAEALKEKLAVLSDIPVVTYVNSPAAVKALSTICCTSANAIQVVNSLEADTILMAPDRNLAQYTAARTDKLIHIWNGYCPVHDLLTPDEVQQTKSAHPDGRFIAHPECRPDVLELADEVASTSGMIRLVSESSHQTFIIGTEVGILYPLRKANPDKVLVPASQSMVCNDMKKIKLEDIESCLENMVGEVKVPEDIRIPALQAVERMLALTN